MLMQRRLKENKKNCWLI
ncbi:hypothetical protein Gotur_004814 [Gossypium turneri]